MGKVRLKHVIISFIICAFWAFNIAPCFAQTISMGIFPEPGILVSKARASPKISGQNLETALVDIKAVDPPTEHIKDGTPALGSDERFGQGIIIDSNGIIATNKHIVGNAEHIYVALAGGKIFEAKVIHSTQADLTLIKIQAPYQLNAISLGDSSQVQIGNPVYALANAGLNQQRLRDGQVTNMFKEDSSNNIELIEFKMNLQPGDSGGPVLNQQGSLLGLIMGNQKSDTSKSYAIASNKIQQEYLKYKNAILN